MKLSENLGNISDACRKLGVSRQHYYDIKRALEEEGIEGLLEKARNKPRINNRVAPEIEETLLNYSLEYPTYGQVRVANANEPTAVQKDSTRPCWMSFIKLLSERNSIPL